MRTLLVVGGGVEAPPGIRRAKDMGLHVVVSDGNPDAVAFPYADDRLVASTYDVDATVAAAQRYRETVRPIDGALSIGADVPVTVAAVAGELGLPGIPLEAARLAADKLAMRRRFAERGIPIPWFAPVASVEELRSALSDQGLPAIIKPVDSRGARGVLRLTESVDLEWAYEHARSHSPSGRVIVEEYLFGPQISTESVLLPDADATPGFSDRNYEHLERFAPWLIENGGEQPTALSVPDQEAIARLAVRAGRALGMETGVAKGDMVLTPEGPKVVEIAARLSGGFFATDQVPLATGVDLVGIAIRLALGDCVSIEEATPRFHKGVAIRYFFPRPGRITAIENAERFEGVPWVHRLSFFGGVGSVVGEPTDHTRRIGYVIATGETRDDAVAHAREVVDSVRIETVPT